MQSMSLQACSILVSWLEIDVGGNKLILYTCTDIITSVATSARFVLRVSQHIFNRNQKSRKCNVGMLRGSLAAVHAYLMFLIV